MDKSIDRELGLIAGSLESIAAVTREIKEDQRRFEKQLNRVEEKQVEQTEKIQKYIARELQKQQNLIEEKLKNLDQKISINKTNIENNKKSISGITAKKARDDDWLKKKVKEYLILGTIAAFFTAIILELVKNIF